VLLGPYETVELAAAAARAAAEDALDERLEELTRIPLPAESPRGNDEFQALHFDFGIPIVPLAPANVVLFTAIHVPADRPRPSAATRVVDLSVLLAQRAWPEKGELLARLRSYGKSHGSWLGWADDGSYRESQLARLVDALAGGRELLAYPEIARDRWLEASGGGGEFATLAAEREFFARHEMDLAAVEEEVRLEPGETLLIDNVASAHGRIGRRSPHEIVQITFGRRDVAVERQAAVRDQLLACFDVDRLTPDPRTLT
jgi:hypothetical protein